MKKKMISAIAAAWMVVLVGSTAAGAQAVHAAEEEDADSRTRIGEEQNEDAYDDWDLYEYWSDGGLGICEYRDGDEWEDWDIYVYGDEDEYDSRQEDRNRCRCGCDCISGEQDDREDESWLDKYVKDGTITAEEKDRLIKAYDKIEELNKQIDEQWDIVFEIEEKIWA